jgi:hypothetical protein
MNGRDFLDARGGVVALVDFNIVSQYLYPDVLHELTWSLDLQSEVQRADHIDPRCPEFQI